MKTNFKIASFTEIEFKGILLDLHNNFDFFADQIEISENKIQFPDDPNQGIEPGNV